MRLRVRRSGRSLAAMCLRVRRCVQHLASMRLRAPLNAPACAPDGSNAPACVVDVSNALRCVVFGAHSGTLPPFLPANYLNVWFSAYIQVTCCHRPHTQAHCSRRQSSSPAHAGALQPPPTHAGALPPRGHIARGLVAKLPLPFRYTDARRCAGATKATNQRQ